MCTTWLLCFTYILRRNLPNIQNKAVCWAKCAHCLYVYNKLLAAAVHFMATSVTNNNGFWILHRAPLSICSKSTTHVFDLWVIWIISLKKNQLSHLFVNHKQKLGSWFPHSSVICFQDSCRSSISGVLRYEFTVYSQFHGMISVIKIFYCNEFNLMFHFI